MEVTHIEGHGKYNLPRGVGVVLLRLLLSTTSQGDKQADIVILCRTFRGSKLGY